MGCQNRPGWFVRLPLSNGHHSPSPWLLYTKRKQTREECPRSLPQGAAAVGRARLGGGLGQPPQQCCADRSCCELALPLCAVCTCRHPNRPGSRAKLLPKGSGALELWESVDTLPLPLSTPGLLTPWSAYRWTRNKCEGILGAKALGAVWIPCWCDQGGTCSLWTYIRNHFPLLMNFSEPYVCICLARTILTVSQAAD